VPAQALGLEPMSCGAINVLRSLQQQNSQEPRRLRADNI
jgi:hypothetical protein